MFPTLRAEMARHGIKNKDIAELLKLSRKSITNRLSGTQEFSNAEMRQIRDKFFPNMTIDELFSKVMERQVS